MTLKEQEFESEYRNGDLSEVGKCYQCGKNLELKEYTIRQNFADRKIKCCSDLCAQHAQMSSD